MSQESNPPVNKILYSEAGGKGERNFDAVHKLRGLLERRRRSHWRNFSDARDVPPSTNGSSEPTK